jgi:sugar lactone lactonase YvrE
MRVGLADLRFLGSGLTRPECVVAHRSGLIFVSDCTEPGGISVLTPAGRVHKLLATDPEPGVDLPVRPNGIALEPGGSFLLAHLGAERGGVYRLHPDGRCTVVTDRIGANPMPPANFVARDAAGRIWVTVSTTIVPRALDYRPDAASGFVAVHADGVTEIAADGLGYTNECLFSSDGRQLWVVETFGRRLTAFDVDGTRLSGRRVVARFGPGDFPDGIAETEDGALIATSIVSNRLLRIATDGSVERLLEDVEPAHLAEVERAFQAGEMARPHLDTVRSDRLGHVSSIAFAGPDRRTACLGSLLGTDIATFASPVAGRALPHWEADLGPLARYLEDAS